MKKIQQLLIIDDDPTSLRLSEEAAKEVLIVAKTISLRTALEALLYIKENCLPTLLNKNIYCPEMILLDIHMPGINGYEFLAELCALEELNHANTCVVIVSNNPYEQEKDRIKYFPVLGYIEKPVTADKLREVICKPKNRVATN